MTGAFVTRTLYKYFFRPFLFLKDPETVHNRFTAVGSFFGKYPITKTLTRRLFSYQHKALAQTVCGITFKNPVGLAAGFDKDANLTDILEDVGFSFMQVGTVTAKPYGGNPTPRIYRLPRSKGAVIYFGLKNIGVEKIISKLKNRVSRTFPLSISVGKTNSPKTATTQAGIEDYYDCLKKLVGSNTGDFYTINISCPNAFGGEPFTTPKELAQLLEKLTSLKVNKPVFLKMPINVEWQEFKKLLDIAVEFKIEGVIIGNLNKNHQDESVKDAIPSYVQGVLVAGLALSCQTN